MGAFFVCLFYSDLIHCTNEMNVNIPQLADSLFERTTNTSWVVVFKSLITTHHLMVYGNEVSRLYSLYWARIPSLVSLNQCFTLMQRFIQYLASRNTLFNLSNFLDKSGLQGKGLIVAVFKYFNRNHKRNAKCLIFLPPDVSGYDMSTFIRRYSRYLNEKAVSYRQVAFDFTKVKRG